nr:hypothetical protein [Tanacetum cinerariifolium]
MIKEHDQQAKMKATPRKLAYADSDKEALAGSLAKGFSDQFSLESFGISDTRRQTHSTIKSQKTPSKNKEPSHLRRLRRLEDRNTTREKARRERVYEGNKDLEDHLGIFSADAEHKEWPMPIWCKMFRQNLGEAARNWFDDLDPKSVDSFEELSQKFLEEFLQQKRYAKDPTEIHNIKRRHNEGLQAFTDRFKSKSSHIKGVPSVLRISTFMHGHGHPKLAKKLNDKIPETVDKMFERVQAFIRGEVAARARNIGGLREARRNMRVYTRYPKEDAFTPLTNTPKEILAMKSISFPEPPPLIKTPESQNLNKFCDYHGDRGHNTNDCYQLRKQIKEVMALRKLAHLVKDIRQNSQQNGNPGKNGVKVINIIRQEGSHKRSFEKRRMMEKVLAGQRGRNVETYVEEIVIKRKKEGLRADPGRIHEIILSPTPRSPNQIRSLILQLTAISKFISKLTELKHPIREARTRIEIAKESGWTNETEEALRRIKRKLNKLQTLAILK